MPRDNYAQSQIPTSQDAVPYADHREIAQGLGRHMTDSFVGEVVGDGGDVDLTGIPFEPAVIYLSEATGPSLQLQLPGSAGTAIPNATQEVDGTWTITLPVALAPSGDTVSAWCLGFSSNNSL
jgi:hypothetical protein